MQFYHASTSWLWAFVSQQNAVENVQDFIRILADFMDFVEYSEYSRKQAIGVQTFVNNSLRSARIDLGLPPIARKLNCASYSTRDDVFTSSFPGHSDVSFKIAENIGKHRRILRRFNPGALFSAPTPRGSHVWAVCASRGGGRALPTCCIFFWQACVVDVHSPAVRAQCSLYQHTQASRKFFGDRELAG